VVRVQRPWLLGLTGLLKPCVKSGTKLFQPYFMNCFNCASPLCRSRSILEAPLSRGGALTTPGAWTEECGFSLGQLKRAKRALEIECIKAGGSGDPWLWALPEDVPAGSQTEPDWAALLMAMLPTPGGRASVAFFE
jgi:hypothetical protein